MTPEFERRWGVEDVTGHRYMAQLSDGPNGVRWLLPFPRRDFEEMWAALCRQHPEYVEQFGSINNFLRQWVGAVFTYLLSQKELEVDPFIKGLSIMARAQQAEAQIQMMKNLDATMRDASLPKLLRAEAGALLAQTEDDMLNSVLSVTKEQVREFIMQELA